MSSRSRFESSAACRVVVLVGAIDRQREVSDGAAFRCVTNLRVSGEIADEHEFVQGCHGGVLWLIIVRKYLIQ